MLEIIFAEFGGEFKPNKENILKYFPEAKITVLGPEQCPNIFDREHPQWGHLMNDYYKVKGLLDSDADIAISLDADVFIVSEKVRTIIPLVESFGLCLPANPRLLVRIDTLIGSNSDRKLDETEGMGYAFNMTPIALHCDTLEARGILHRYLMLMEENPVRGPLAMWRAAKEARTFPCLLPPQWCVCRDDIGINNEVILHIGHEKVKKYYEGILR